MRKRKKQLWGKEKERGDFLFFLGVQRTVMANHLPGAMHSNFFHSYSNPMSGYCHCTHFTGEEISFGPRMHVLVPTPL